MIDAKRYRGRPRLQVDGGLVRRRTERLLVGRRDRTALVDGVHEQVALVRGLVGDDVPVHGVLCFVDADWPVVGGAFTTRGVVVEWPRRLVRRLERPGPVLEDLLIDLHRALASTFPPA